MTQQRLTCIRCEKCNHLHPKGYPCWHCRYEESEKIIKEIQEQLTWLETDSAEKEGHLLGEVERLENELAVTIKDLQRGYRKVQGLKSIIELIASKDSLQC